MFWRRRLLAERGIVLIQELVIEMVVDNFSCALLDLADINKHSVAWIHRAGKNKIRGVVAAGAVKRLRLRTKSDRIFAVGPAGYKQAARSGKFEAFADRQEHDDATLFLDEREKFRTCARIIFERAEQAGSFHDRVLFLDPAHHHAQMFGFDHNGNPTRMQSAHERLSNLRCQVLLNLQTACEKIDITRDFREAADFAVWNGSHVRAADEGE